MGRDVGGEVADARVGLGAGGCTGRTCGLQKNVRWPVGGGAVGGAKASDARGYRNTASVCGGCFASSRESRSAGGIFEVGEGEFFVLTFGGLGGGELELGDRAGAGLALHEDLPAVGEFAEGALGDDDA